MLKRVFLFLLALVLGFQMTSLWAFAAEDSGSPKHIPRIVSIVFDDSGSMYNKTDRWAYTSYAMQSFAAMMGSEDVLYITYLNAPAGTVKVDLSDGAKHATVNSFYDIMFGGGTPNRVQAGADCLEREFAAYKTDAKYYLVVMTDGELDSGLGKLADKVASAAATTEAKLAGADFETIYFSMKSGSAEAIPGVSVEQASTNLQIVDALKKVSAGIMGRTEIDHSVADGKVTFTLPYPALNITVFAQKQNGNFDSFQTSVQKDGQAFSCQVNNYNIKCPTKITKNTNTSVYKEGVPENPPAGVVSLITDGGKAMAKGTYSVDVSGYDLQTGDVVVLVEPAVRIGCAYRLNDDDATITFEELKKRVCEGDTVTVECALYEMNADGTLGDAVSLDVLSPEYKVLVNGKQVGTAVPGATNAYAFQVDKEFENKEMKVEALLTGYQPFVIKETFGELNIKIQAKPLPDGADEIALTKPLWKKWSAGEEGIRFELERVDATVLEKIAIVVEGSEGLPTGICSALTDAISTEGNTIVYTPKAELAFSQLPASFTVGLKNLDTAQVMLKKTVKVVQPAYRFETDNQLSGVSLSLEQLKQNTAAVSFVLTVDYEGNGQYLRISESDCEGEIKLTLSSGVLPGTTSEDKGQIRFVPRYDPADATVSAADLNGKDHILFATAVTDSGEIKSEEIKLSVSSAAYRLEVENQISQPLSLDTLKTNQQAVIFKLLADYEGSGNFGPLADWDTAAIDALTVSSGDLPGKSETAYDADGNPIGKAFIPLYDENNNGGVLFTAVAGKTHQIIGSVESMNLSATASVDVLMPDYDISVRKDGIEITDVLLRGNTEGVEFTVLRDGRVLNLQELTALSSYSLSFDKEQPWINVASQAMDAGDGTAYLLCVPQYGGWRFPGTWCWNWLCLFRVAKGDMHMILTLGEDTAAATLTVTTSELAWMVFFISLGVLFVILWLIFCWATRIRFLRGSFYKVSFRKSSDGLGYVVSSRVPQNANRGGRAAPIFPFREQTVSVIVETHKAKFTAKKSPVETFNCRSFPYSDTDANQKHFNKGHLSKQVIRSIINRDPDLVLDGSLLEGTPCGESDKKMASGNFLVEKGSTKIIFFLTKNDEKTIRNRKSSRRDRGTNRKTRRST